MKSLKTTGIITLLIIAMSGLSAIAQTKADIFSGSAPISFLGIDYSQAKFIGSAQNSSVAFSAWGGMKKTDNGIVSPEEFRDSFTLQWNQLFIDEYKKYDIASAIHHNEVKYALDIAEAGNKAIKEPAKLFSDNPADFKLTDEAKIAAAVKGYNFGKNDGIGLIIFAGGMSKGLAKMGLWITFVDMKGKNVLLTKYIENKPGGFGFMAYWAKPIYLALKDVKSDYNSWK